MAYVDTNSIWVTGAGEAGANGYYTNKSRNIVSGNGQDVWTNNAGTYGIVHDPAGAMGDLAWVLTNAPGGSIRYDASEQASGLGQLPGQSWSVAAGTGPAPNPVNYGTNYATLFEVVANQNPIPIYVQTNCLFVMTNGNNLFGLRGRMDRPYKSLNYAVTNAALAGDTIFVFPGVYDVSDWQDATATPNNLSVIGAGRNAVLFTGMATSQTKFGLGSSNYWANFSSTNCWYYGLNGAANSTNAMIENVDASASGDVVVVQNTTFGFTARNCRLSGNSDKFADLSSLQGNASDYATNYYLSIENCTVAGGNGQDGDGLNILSGRLRKRLVSVYSEVANGTKMLGSTTNGLSNALPGFLKTPQIIRTNFISGLLYTNVFGRDVEVSFTVTNVQAAVAGTTQFDLWVMAQNPAAPTVTGTTNTCGSQTLGTSLATTNIFHVAAWVPAGYVWVPTNRSAGAGNASGPRGGQIYIP